MAQPKVICLTNGAFQENCYLVIDEATRDAIIVDPGEEAELFLRRIEFEKASLQAIWLTHAHLDHILGVARVVESTGVPIYLHPADRSLYNTADEQGGWLGIPAETPPPPDHELSHGDVLSLGDFQFEVRHVPGHSPGGVAIIGHGIAFVGDAVFAGSIGRTDLPGGNAETLLKSIHEQLLTLPEETVVYSGHGPPTTIGQERRTNPFLTGEFRVV